MESSTPLLSAVAMGAAAFLLLSWLVLARRAGPAGKDEAPPREPP
jgi:hypothetical protein